MAPETITLTQAAAMAGVSRRTVQRWIALGLIADTHVRHQGQHTYLTGGGICAIKTIQELRNYLPLEKIRESQQRLNELGLDLGDSEIAIVTDALGELRVLKLSKDGAALPIDADPKGAQPLIPNLAEFVIHDIINSPAHAVPHSTSIAVH